MSDEHAVEIEGFLFAYWDKFGGSDAEAMNKLKLYGRVEKLVWSPPTLSFTIERHGGTVLGSSRGELHTWVLDLEKLTASCHVSGFRQLRATRPRLDVKPIAKLVAKRIVGGRQDNLLSRKADGTTVVMIGKLIPAEGLPKQTLEGRRKRFRQELDRLMAERGWEPVRPNAYRKKDG